MKRSHLFGLCLVFAPICAEMIGPITYRLPEEGAWSLVDHFESCRGTSDIYTPYGVTRERSTEYFGVHQTIHTSSIDSLVYFEQSLQAMYPKCRIEFRVLQRDQSSALVEWGAFEEDAERVRGLSRLFAVDHSTVILSHFNFDKGCQEESREIWLPLLMRAEVTFPLFC